MYAARKPGFQLFALWEKIRYFSQTQVVSLHEKQSRQAWRIAMKLLLAVGILLSNHAILERLNYYVDAGSGFR
jgi:hypothetical protein